MAARSRARFPLMAMGALALFFGLDAGLVRVGWAVPLPHLDLPIAHGPLMVCGFLGTLISVERAVALNRPWGYLAPLLTGLGGVGLIAMPTSSTAALSITLGSTVLVIMFAVMIRRQPELFTVCMGLGALVWLVGNALWLARWPLFTVVPWWIGFLLLTIAGERLELSRLLRLTRRSRMTFLVILGMFLASVVLTAVDFATDQDVLLLSGNDGDLLFASRVFAMGEHLRGLAMLGLGVWLLQYDIARRTVRQAGLTRFIAVCLLSGYVWLGVSGVLGLYAGGIISGLYYDALLHSFFLGFVFSMIFGHAPIIVPGVLGVPISFRPAFYAHLALLHLTLILRVGGDLVYWLPGRQWGGLLNALVLLFFLANTGASTRKAVAGDRWSVKAKESGLS